MKVIKPFFLGVLGGLGLALVLLVGLFFTPLREDLYFSLDPEMADIRSKLDRYQEWLAQTDLRIAEHENAGADSLRNAQTKAWRYYKGWRNRLGELARAHARPTAEGFWPWTYSLRFWILPIAVFLALFPGLLLALRARSRFRPGKAKPAKGRGKPPHKARAQALSNFEEAIKKVARISETDRGNSLPAGAAPKPAEAFLEPPTAYLEPPDASPVREARPAPVAETGKRKEPDTVPMAVLPEAEAPGTDNGRDTRFIQVGPGGGGSPQNQPPGERIGNPASALPPRLSMEDEDAADTPSSAAASGPADEGEEAFGVMPPTTEVERVERRKDEVLKLARKGMTSSEISRRMRISQDQVEFIIRLRREKG